MEGERQNRFSLMYALPCTVLLLEVLQLALQNSNESLRLTASAKVFLSLVSVLHHIAHPAKIEVNLLAAMAVLRSSSLEGFRQQETQFS